MTFGASVLVIEPTGLSTFLNGFSYLGESESSFLIQDESICFGATTGCLGCVVVVVVA
jgi:hypothetical protein